MMKTNLAKERLTKNSSRFVLQALLRKLGLAGLALGLVTGCGSAATPVGTVTYVGAQPVGTIPYYGVGITGQCGLGYSADFTTTCRMCWGGSPTVINGRSVCRVQQAMWTWMDTLGIPILDPKVPASNTAAYPRAVQSWPTTGTPLMNSFGVQLKRGFTLAFDGDGSFDLGNAICGNGNDYDFNGYKEGTLMMNSSNNEPMALYGSDGVESFKLGKSMGARTINNDGLLRIGFNIDSSKSSSGCYRVKSMKFTVTGCVDAAMNSVACN